MTRLEKMVVETFFSDYPIDASYRRILELVGSDRVELMERFSECDPEEIREAMFFLHLDAQNLITQEILDYDKKFLRSNQEANVAPH